MLHFSSEVENVATRLRTRASAKTSPIESSPVQAIEISKSAH